MLHGHEVMVKDHQGTKKFKILLKFFHFQPNFMHIDTNHTKKLTQFS